MQLNDSNNKTLENFSFSNFNCAHFERMTATHFTLTKNFTNKLKELPWEQKRLHLIAC